MSLDPSYNSPPIVFDPLPPEAMQPVEIPPGKWQSVVPPLPGKRHGILSILCGVYPILPIAFIFLVVMPFATNSEPPNLLIPVFFALCFATPLFTITGIAYGIRGLETEGRSYAFVGLVFSGLSALLVLGIVGFIAYAVLVPCC